MNKNKALIEILPWIFVILWSTGFLGLKWTTPYAAPLYIMFLRGALSLIALGVIALLLKLRWPSLTVIKYQLVVGFALQFMFMFGGFVSVHMGFPVAFAALITGIQPILTALILTGMGKESLNKKQWFSIMIGFIGIIIVLHPYGLASAHHFPLIAIGVSVIGLVGMTLGTILQKLMSEKVKKEEMGSPVTQIFFQYITLTVVAGILTFFFDTHTVQWSVSFVCGLLWLVIGLSLIAILLLLFMIENGAATKVATYFYLVPALTAVEAWFLFGQKLSIDGIVGIIISIIGIASFMRAGKIKENEKKKVR